MQKTFIINFLILIFLTSCLDIRLSWTDKKIKDLWKTLPDDVNQSVTLLDTILSVRAKDHFKNTEESIAVLEISRDLGQSFINGWHLIAKGQPYNRPKKKGDTWSEIHGLSNYSNLSYFFNRLGISDPSEMVRIIFTCYHKKLNNSSFDLPSIINAYKSFWVNSTRFSAPGATNSNYWFLDSKIKNLEDSLLNKYLFAQANINDTVFANLFYSNYKFTSKPTSYYIEGVIVNKDSIKYVLNVKLLQISASDNNSIWYDDKIQRRVDDIFELKANQWNTKGKPKFYY